VTVPPPDNLSVGCNTESILSDDGAVGFEKKSTTFRDEAGARRVLAKFATWLRETSGARATVVGSIAHYGQDEGDSGLSRDRAVRVRNVLVTLGARPEQVTARGAGWGPFPDKQAPPDAISDSRNRRVVIRLSC
jgi:outer membrane protein OmpA-like peptidoglycan-associated protein